MCVLGCPASYQGGEGRGEEGRGGEGGEGRGGEGGEGRGGEPVVCNAVQQLRPFAS